MEATIDVFISYAHEDEDLRNELEKRLKLLKRNGLINLWHDHNISAGAEWASEVDAHLSTAQIILLLVSPDFLDSDYCYSIEMTRALKRHEAGEARVIPIILRPADWEYTPLHTLLALPKGALPVTEWQSLDKAFLDVARGIRMAVEELQAPSLLLSIPHATAQIQSMPQVWNVPRSRTPFFTGQEALLSSLHDKLKSDQSVALTRRPRAISGLGGIGKTEIATEYAYRYGNEYRTVLWVEASSRETLIRDYVVIAGRLDLLEKNVDDQSKIIKAVKDWLAAHDRWLLIFDNADNIPIIDEFLPSLVQGQILLTTRTMVLGRLAEAIEVQSLGHEEGILFLLRRAKVLLPSDPLDRAPIADRIAAEEIVQAVNGLPLALDQAGAYIEEAGCSVSYYLGLYRNQPTALLQQRGESSTDHPESVYTTYSLSFARVEQENLAAADLLRLCAFFHPDAIPEELFTKAAPHICPSLQAFADDQNALNKAIKALRKYSLVRRDTSTQTLSIHRVVQAVQVDGMGADRQFQWAAHAVQVLSRVFPGDMTWSLCERYIIHAQTCTDLIKQWKMEFEEARTLLGRAGTYLYERARYEDATLFQQLALSISAQIEPNEPTVANDASKLARTYHAWGGHFKQAEELYQRVIDIYERTRGSEHPSVAHALNDLASLYTEQGLYEKAAEPRRRADTIYEREMGASHLHTIPNALLGSNDRASVDKSLGSNEQATPPDYDDAPGIHERLDDLDVAYKLNKYARDHVKRGRYELATSPYQRALTICERMLGPDHTEVVPSLDGLASVYYSREKFERAISLFERKLIIIENTAPNSIGEADSLYHLALPYYSQQQYKQAIPLFQRALKICEGLLGPGDPKVADYLHALGVCLLRQGDYEQAEPHLQHVLAIYEQVQEPNNSNLVSGLEALALCYTKQGHYEQASPLLQRVLAIRERMLGLPHPDTIESLNDLAISYYKQGKFTEMCSIYEDYQAVCEQNALAAANRGTMYLLIGRYTSAVVDFNRAITLGDTRPWTFTQRGEAYLRMERYNEALVDFDQALKLDQHYTRALAYRGIVHQKLKRDTEALTDLDRVIELEGKDDWAWFCRARIHLSRDQKGEFERDIQVAIELAQAEWEQKPGDYRVGFNLALYLLVSGKKEDAKEQYKQLASACSSSSIGWLQGAVTDVTDFMAFRPHDAVASYIYNQLQERLIKLQAAGL